MSNSVQTANKSTYGFAVKLLVWKRNYVFRNGRRIIPMMRNSSSVEFCMPFETGWGTATSKITFATYFIMKTFLMKISSSLYLRLLLIIMSEMNNLSSIKRKSTKFKELAAVRPTYNFSNQTNSQSCFPSAFRSSQQAISKVSQFYRHQIQLCMRAALCTEHLITKSLPFSTKI